MNGFRHAHPQLFRREAWPVACVLLAACGSGPQTCRSCDTAGAPGGVEGPPELEVAARPAKPGEPVALEGGGNLICTQRSDAKRACAGNFGWRFRSRTSDDEFTKYSDQPIVPNLPYENLEGSSGLVYATVNGRPIRWFVEASDRSPQEIRFVGPSSEYEYTGPSSCGIDGKTARCISMPSCGKEAKEVFDLGDLTFEFTFDRPITSLASNEKTCVSLDDGTVHCWGEHFTEGSDKPACVYDRTTPVEGLTDAVSLAPGPADSICALRANGSVVCWGRNAADQFGVPEKEVPFSETPMPLADLEHTVRLHGQDSGIAALQADGSIFYWGHPIVRDVSGKLGPQKASLPEPAVDVLVMSKGVCALLTDRSVYCFGGRFDRLREEKGGARIILPFEGLDPWVNAAEYEPEVDFPLIPPAPTDD